MVSLRVTCAPSLKIKYSFSNWFCYGKLHLRLIFSFLFPQVKIENARQNKTVIVLENIPAIDLAAILHNLVQITAFNPERFVDWAA